MTVKGIDVSQWQASTPSLTGFGFLFARASIALRADPMYLTHIANARKAGLLVGAYHFNDNGISVVEQAAMFLRTAGDVDFYAIDVEGGSAFSHAQTGEFITRVKATGRKIGLYHSLSGYFDVGQDWRWVAYYSTTPPPIHWDFWQRRGSPLDLDDFNGDFAALRLLANQEAPMVKFKAPLDEVGGTITTTRDTLAIPMTGGSRPSVRGGITRPAIGVFTLTDLGDRPCYLMLVGPALCFVGAADVTFTPNGTSDCTAAINADRLKAKVTWA